MKRIIRRRTISGSAASAFCALLIPELLIPGIFLPGTLLPEVYGDLCYAQSTAPVVKGQKNPTSTLGVEVVYITQDHAAQPKTITRASGPFLLIIVNRTTRPILNMSVIPAVTSTVAAAPGAPAAGSSVPAAASGVLNDKSLQLVLNLPKGSYSIAEASRADWAVDLEIQ